MPVISLNSLRDLFKRSGDKNTTVYAAECYNCGTEVRIRIDSISGGFGLLGGKLYESGSNNLFAECLDCCK